MSLLAKEDALKIVLESAFYLGSEKVDLMNSKGRILAEDVVSDINMPPFNKSAYDGFACRKQDLKNELEVIEDIPAGKFPEKKLSENQCSRIMTGAPVPENADCVIAVEHTATIDSGKIVFKRDFSKSNIAKKAEDVKVGDVVLKKGTLIKAQHIAILASLGYAEVEVSKQPQVAVMSTGDELVEPYEKPGLSQIRNSNSYQTLAQLQDIGIQGNYYGIVKDDFQITYDTIKKAMEENDLVILSGGVSMGDYDFVPKVFEKLGVKIKFSKIAVQPGKPATFGVADNALLIGLPGNPVSSFTVFEVIVKSLIYKMMDFNYIPPYLYLPIAEDYSRKKDSRDSFYPAIVNKKSEVELLDYHGSAHLNALSDAKVQMMIPRGVKEYKKGDLVYVRQI